MKIIFLDIDGVLNSEEWMRSRSTSDIDSRYPFYEFCPDLVDNLNYITDSTGAKIVVSSSWRIGRSVEDLQALFKNVGVTGEVIDKTPSMVIKDEGYTIPRGCEIERWLDLRKFQRINWSREKQLECIKECGIENYIIIDDETDMLYRQHEHFIKTSWKHGLSKYIADKAVEILSSSILNLYYPEKICI